MTRDTAQQKYNLPDWASIPYNWVITGYTYPHLQPRSYTNAFHKRRLIVHRAPPSSTSAEAASSSAPSWPPTMKTVDLDGELLDWELIPYNWVVCALTYSKIPRMLPSRYYKSHRSPSRITISDGQRILITTIFGKAR